MVVPSYGYINTSPTKQAMKKMLPRGRKVISGRGPRVPAYWVAHSSNGSPLGLGDLNDGGLRTYLRKKMVYVR